MSGNPLKLTIKAANQKFSDYVIDSCELDWSVRKLKQHLSDNYPRNPVSGCFIISFFEIFMKIIQFYLGCSINTFDLFWKTFAR